MHADVHTYRYHLARDLNDLAMLLKDLDRLPDAEELYRQAVAIHKQLVAEFPDEPQFRDALAQAHLNLRHDCSITPSGRERPWNRSLRPRRSTRNSPPTFRPYLGIAMSLPSAATTWVIVLRDAERHPEAEEIFRQALTIRRQLVDEFPVVPEYRRGLAIP